jgi:hypothetical protein
MKRIQKISWQAGYVLRLWWWWSVGWRWERASWCVWWRVVGRARQSVREWRACGSVPEWRPVRACRRLALVRALRVGLAVGGLVVGPLLVALLVRWLG